MGGLGYRSTVKKREYHNMWISCVDEAYIFEGKAQPNDFSLIRQSHHYELKESPRILLDLQENIADTTLGLGDGTFWIGKGERGGPRQNKHITQNEARGGSASGQFNKLMRLKVFPMVKVTVQWASRIFRYDRE